MWARKAEDREELFGAASVQRDMKILVLWIVAFCLALSVARAEAQQEGAVNLQATAQGVSDETMAENADASPVPLEWTPPALEELTRQAAVKSSFTLDRNLLGVAAAMVPDSDAGERQAIRKLDGVSVH